MPSYGDLAVWSAFFCFAAAPVGGSVVSFLYCGGAALALIEAARGRYPIVLSRDAKLATAGIVLFIAAYVLSGLINGEIFEAPDKYAWLLILLALPLSTSLAATAGKSRMMGAVIWGSATGCVGALLIALIQMHVLGDDLGDSRVEGGAGNSLVFGTVTALCAVVTLAGAMRHRGWRRLILILCFAAGLGAVVYSGQRGVWPAVLLSPLLIGLAWRSEFSTGRAMALSQAALLGSTVAALALFEWFTSRFNLLLQDLGGVLQSTDYHTSLGQRLAIWEVGATLIEEKPVVGYGILGAQHYLEAQLLSGYGINAEFTHYHNLFMTTVAEAGLIGTVALLFLLLAPAWTASRVLWRNNRDPERFGAVLILLALLTFVVSGLTNKLFGHDLLMSMLGLCLSIGLFLSAGTQRSP